MHQPQKTRGDIHKAIEISPKDARKGLQYIQQLVLELIRGQSFNKYGLMDAINSFTHFVNFSISGITLHNHVSNTLRIYSKNHHLYFVNLKIG